MRKIDADAWIDKLNKIINDPEAPGELIDHCYHMINEIEAEIHAQGKENE